jgi:hypothetical protein
MSIRRTENLEEPFGDIVDPFGITNFRWIGPHRKLYTLSREVDKLSFYDIPTAKVSVVRELKVDTTVVPFTSDYSLCAVIGVNKSTKEYIQLISLGDFTMLTNFEIKSKNTDCLLFTQHDNCLLVCERHYTNSLYLYSITGLLIREISLPGTLFQARILGDKILVVDDETNLLVLDDVCLGVYMSKNVLKMVEELTNVTRFQEVQDGEKPEILRKRRGELTRVQRHQGRQATGDKTERRRAVRSQTDGPECQLRGADLRWTHKLGSQKLSLFSTGTPVESSSPLIFWSRFL